MFMYNPYLFMDIILLRQKIVSYLEKNVKMWILEPLKKLKQNCSQQNSMT